MGKIQWIIAILAVTVSICAAGCANTLKGVGKDTQAAGRAIQDSVDK